MGSAVRRRTSSGRPFRLLLVASTASNLGDGVLLAAVPLLARRASDDPLAVAAVSAAATGPWLLFGLFAGAFVDRWDRRRTMVVADVVRATLLGAFTVVAVAAGTPPLGVLAALVFALGAAETVFDTAAQAILPSVVASGELERANGRLFGLQIAANGFVGPPLGAFLFAAGLGLPFALDGVTFAVSAAVLVLLPRRASDPGYDVRPPASVLHDIREGLAWLWRHRDVRALAAGAAVVNLAHAGAMAVAVLLVRDELGAGAVAFGTTLTGAAVGSIVGTQAASWVVGRLGRVRSITAAVGSFTASLLAIAVAPTVAVVAVGLAVFGAAGEVWNVVAVSYRQARVPDRLLGRVMATYRVIAYGSMPVGAAAGGLVARAWGVRATFVAGALATTSLLVFLRSRRGLLLAAAD